jgi:hypothetical protein
MMLLGGTMIWAAADVPSGIPQRAAAAVAMARQWHSDAVLDRVEFEPGQMAPVKCTFHSLKSREWEVIFEFGGKLTAQSFPMDADYSFLDPIGVNFVDLPKDIDAARAAGLTDYSFALLSQVVTRDRGKVAAWRIAKFVVDASTGKVIPPSSLPDDSIGANRNPQQTNGGQNAECP